MATGSLFILPLPAPAVVKRERGAGVLQSANLWSRPVTLFACTFASGCATEARIAEFFRELARPAGFEPATLGLEGPVSERLSHRRLSNRRACAPWMGRFPPQFDRFRLAATPLR